MSASGSDDSGAATDDGTATFTHGGDKRLDDGNKQLRANENKQAS